MGHGEWRNGAWLAEVERQVKCVRCTTLREKSCSRPRTAAPRLRTPQCTAPTPHLRIASQRGTEATRLPGYEAGHRTPATVHRQVGAWYSALALRIAIPSHQRRGTEAVKLTSAQCRTASALCPLPCLCPAPHSVPLHTPYSIPHTPYPYPIPHTHKPTVALWHCGPWP